ncbi:MAG: MFS transporter [Halobaculum sp.]
MALLDVDRRVIALGFARMADSLGNSFLIVVLPAYIASVVGRDGMVVGGTALATPLLVGVVLSLFGFLNSGLQPLTGRLSDRAGTRRGFILLGLALLGAASAVYPLADSYPAILALRGFQGIGAALTIPATVALVNEVGDAGSRGGNFGVFNTFRLVGFGFGPFVAGAVQQAYGFTAAFAVAVVGAAVGFGLVFLLIEDPDEVGAEAADDVSLSVRGEDGGLDPVFALGVATVVMAMGLALFATLEGPVNERLDQGAFLFGAQFGVAVLANVVLQAPIGSASDRVGRRPFILGGFVLLVPATAVQGFVTTSETMLLARLLQGVAVAMVFSPSLALVGDLAGRGQSGSTLAVLTTGFGLGVAIGPLVSGVLVTVGYAVPFLAVAGLGLVALLIVFTQVGEPDVGERDASGPPAPGE